MKFYAVEVLNSKGKPYRTRRFAKRGGLGVPDWSPYAGLFFPHEASAENFCKECAAEGYSDVSHTRIITLQEVDE